MNEITVAYHLLLPSIISVIILGVIWYKRKRLFRDYSWKLYWISLTVFFLVYLLVVGGATFEDINVQLKLNQLDLNNDGIFNGAEINAEQQEAYNHLIHDTGRNFAFITGIFFASVVALAVFITGKALDFIKLKGQLK